MKQYEYGHNFKEAFDLLNITYNEAIYKKVIKELIKEDYSESGICYAIRKNQEYLKNFIGDHRFWNILQNEVRKDVRKVHDPYWEELDKKQRYNKEQKEIQNKINKETNNKARERTICYQIKNGKYTSYVYFVQGEHGGAIKIGYSENVNQRIKELQTGYPDKLILLGKIHGSYEIESKIHDELENYKLKGEWFKPNDYVINVIKKYMDELGVPTYVETDKNQ